MILVFYLVLAYFFRRKKEKRKEKRGVGMSFKTQTYLSEWIDKESLILAGLSIGDIGFLCKQ